MVLWLIAGLIIGLLLSSSIVLAAGTNKTINVIFNKVNLTVNGKPIAIDNLTYNGTTYVPMRAVAETLGKVVGWDAKTNTASINDEDYSPQAKNIGYDRSNPAGLGVQLSIDYKDYLDTYKANVTVKEIKRGEDAWSMIQAANMFNDPAKDGYEYIITKIKFELIEYDKAFDLNNVLFVLISKSGKAYDFPMIVAPDPGISTQLYKGANHKGWAVFQVEKTDDKPVIAFGRSYDGTGGIWFKAY